jgi:ribitol 2-dehydrogenase
MTEQRFDRAVAIVTGSSSGIGRAIARMLSSAGATVVLVARNAERLAAVAANLPGPSLVLAGDLSDAQFCGDVAERTASDYGRIDILVSNAGIYVPGDFAATDLGAVEQLVGVNVFGAMAVVRTVLPTMLEAGRGDIVMTSSVSGHQAIYWEPVYSASKHAVQAFTHGVRRQLAGSGVRIGAIAPGKVLNELWGYDESSDTSSEVDNATGITDADVADAVHFMLTRPRHVTIRDLVMLPSAQEI